MLKDLIKANRSCRAYDSSRKVTEEELLEMVDCARMTASAINKQPLKYYITNDPNKIEAISANLKLGGLLPNLKLPPEGEEPQAYIVICQDLNISKSDIGFLKDVGIVAQTITLAATEMGLAGCMIGNYIPERIEQVLGFDKSLRVQMVISIGKSMEKYELVEIDAGESTNYYRGEDGTHFVPKRKLEDIIIRR